MSGPRRWVWSAGAAAIAALLPFGPAPLAQTTDDPVDRSVKLVGASISDLANRLDSFFGNERVEAEANRTRARLSGVTGWVDGRGVSFNGSFDLRLSLPRTNERLNLFLNGGKEDLLDQTVQQNRPPGTAIDNDNTVEAVGLGVRYFFLRRPDQSLRVDAGVRKPFAPDPFVQPRFRLTFHTGDWAVSPIQEAGWSSDDGFNARGLLDADPTVSDKRLLRLSAGVRWDENLPGFGYGLAARELQLIGPGRAVETGALIDFRSEPTHRVETVELRVRYRQTVWWDWLEFEIAPELTFPRTRDYEATAGIFARIDVILGHGDIKFNPNGRR